jgi:hypothetical protein
MVTHVEWGMRARGRARSTKINVFRRGISMRLRNILVISTVPVLLSACAAVPSHELLPMAARDKLTATEVAVPIPQSEIYVFVPQSQLATYGGGGLILALIDAGVDSVRTSKAEDAVKPLRDAMVDYDFDGSFQSDLKTSLSQVSFLHPDSVHVVKAVNYDAFDGVIAASKDSAVLFTTTDYHLSNDADMLDVTVRADLIGNSADLRALKPWTAKHPSEPANALYRNTFTYEVHLIGAGSDRPTNIAMLSADHGAALRKELQTGESKIAGLIAADIQRTESDPAPTGPEMTITNTQGINMVGNAVSHDSDGALVIFKDGTEMFIGHATY